MGTSFWNKRVVLLHWLGYFLFANALLFLLIGLSYYPTITLFGYAKLTPLSKILLIIFLIFSYLGHLGILAYLNALIIIPILLIIPNRTLIFITSILALTFAAIVLTIDCFVYRVFHFHLTGIMLDIIFSSHPNQFFGFTRLEFLIMLGMALIILLIEVLLAFSAWRVLRSKKSFRTPIFLLTLIILPAYFSYLFFIFTMPNQSFYYLKNTVNFLPYYNNIVEKFIPKKYDAVIERAGERLFLQADKLNRPVQYPLHPLVFAANKSDTYPNILFIVIDSWRFDMLTKAVTPNLYRFAQKSWVFQQHDSGGNSTRAGIFSLFYSIPATYWTAIKKQHISPLFIDELLKHQYQIGIFPSAPLDGPDLNKTVFIKIKNLQPTLGANPKQRDQQITQNFLNFLNQDVKKNQPFFSFLFYDSAHTFCKAEFPQPFQPVAQMCDRIFLTNTTNPQPLLNRYKNALVFVDQEIDKIIQTLQQHQLLQNTVIIITGDHAQEFNDNHMNYWIHGSNYTPYQVQTPLIVYFPNTPSKIFTYRTSHYDIVPTLLSRIFKCENSYQDYSVGTSLLNSQTRPYLVISSYIDFAIIANDQIIRIYPSGNYLIENSYGQSNNTAKLNMNLVNQVLKKITQFYH